ncbi:TetR family transcriptional regulator [Streptomyces sp. NPDC051954]|uniref:TetR family transcriptional regulator n=1 Tax=unclassified Streptomyces TaxID=2593676 RepID=UPI00341CAF37
MAKPVVREPLRRNSRANRARILATARRELGRNPDITLEELARAAGVVRRTLFGHFPGREALLEALAEEAAEALRRALPEGAELDGQKAEQEAEKEAEQDSPEEALARLVYSLWPVGDRYRLLLSLTQRDLGAERVAEVLAPARERVTAILERGQRDGVFHAQLPAAVLSAGLEAMTVALLESVNTGALEDDGSRAATVTLIAAGVSEERAQAVVEAVAATLVVVEEPADDD